MTEEEALLRYESMFSKLEFGEVEMLYECLVHCLRSNAGIGFKSSNQDYHYYHIVADGGDLTNWDDVDGPDRNELYQMMKVLGSMIYDKAPVMKLRNNGLLVSTWKDFCRIAVAGAKRFNCKPSVPRYLDEENPE